MNLLKLSKCLIASSVAIAASLNLSAQDDLPFDSGSDGSDGPLIVPTTASERYAFAYAYDIARDETVLFGGRKRSNSSVYPTETWTFDGDEWTLETPATFVSGRFNSDMVYDATRQVCVMFGGTRADGVLLNDTWIWNGTDWTEVTPATVPAARTDHEMVWDPVGERVIMFGGNTDLDVWAWDGTDWTQLAATNTPRDSYNTWRTRDDMVFESSTGRLILYNAALTETYAFDLTTLTWSTLSTGSNPSVGTQPVMVYDPVRSETLLAGGSSNAQTWIFASGVWSQQSPANGFTQSYDGGLVFDTAEAKALRFYGYGADNFHQETHAWDGTDWEFIVGRNFEFDMTAKADGVWNFTDIYVPADIEVTFKKNAANSPVVWLATGDVIIDGTVIVRGEDAIRNDQSGSSAQGGPGGFAGGTGGVRFDVSGTYVGTPGQGPGGAIAPTEATTAGTGGTYDGTYGNRLIQPLIGGSGGSGASASDSTSGGNGGGGGGAIMIASSRDIEVNGSIDARGGYGRAVALTSNGRYGGGGSGGAIRLVADRVLGTGTLSAIGGDSFSGNTFDGGNGRIRIEAFFRPLVPNASPAPSASAPTETDSFTTNRSLWISNLAGEAVGDTPTGNMLTPDVVFSQAGTVNVVVQSMNIPVGTPVKLRITSSESTILLPADGDPEVTLNASGIATFTATVPAGVGTVQATAEFVPAD